MSRIHPQAAVADFDARAEAPVRAAIELTKPGITRLVVITTAVGFAMAALQRTWTGGELVATALACLIGTALSASGANALNQWVERERDALMRRTSKRPLPSGRLTPRAAMVVGLVLSILGVATLWALVNGAAAAVSAATILSYLLMYTPLKPVTPLATLVGAVPGALPPLIGWAGAWSVADGGGWASLTTPGGWTLFTIMLVWQIPHFLAIAWMHKEDYARGGHRVLSTEDPDGARTATASLFWLAALIPLSLIPAAAMPGLLGWGYVIAAAVLGGAFFVAGLRFAMDRSRASAVRMFVASILHLPLLLLAMVIDAVVTVAL